MIDSLEGFARIVGLGRPRPPNLLANLDAWLVRNHPLIWQTRFHLVLGWALLSMPAGFAAGWCVAGITLSEGAASVRTLQELLFFNAAFGLGTLAYTALWSGLTGQYMLRHFRGPQSLRLAILSLVAVTATLLPAIATAAGQSWHIARALPEAKYRDDIKLHRDHGFWRCGGEADERAVKESLPQIKRSLARFGVFSGGAMLQAADGQDSDCEPAPHLDMGTSSNLNDSSRAAGVLRGRIELIERCSADWSGGFAGGLWRTAGQFALHFGAAALIALMLTFATGSIGGLVERLRDMRLPSVELPMPRWLAARARRRLLNDPLWWGARPLVVMCWSSLIGCALFCAIAVDVDSLTACIWSFAANGVFAAAVPRVRQATPAGRAPSRLLVALLTGAVSPAVLISVLSLVRWSSGRLVRDESVYCITLVAGSLLLVAGLAVRAFFSRMLATLAIGLAAGATVLPVVFAPLVRSIPDRSAVNVLSALLYGGAVMIWCCLAVLVHARRHGWISPPLGIVASFVATSMPTAAFFASISAIYALLSLGFKSSDFFDLLLAVGFAAGAVAGLLAWRPAFYTLARASHQPKSS